MGNRTKPNYSEAYFKQVGTTWQTVPCVQDESCYCFKETLSCQSVSGVADWVCVCMLHDREGCNEVILKTHERQRSSELVAKAQVSLGHLSGKVISSYGSEWEGPYIVVEEVLEGLQEKRFQPKCL